MVKALLLTCRAFKVAELTCLNTCSGTQTLAVIAPKSQGCNFPASANLQQQDHDHPTHSHSCIDFLRLQVVHSGCIFQLPHLCNVHSMGEGHLHIQQQLQLQVMAQTNRTLQDRLPACTPRLAEALS